MDAQQDVTLGEIYRSVVRIEQTVNGLVSHHAETRELVLDHSARLGHIDHYINNAKHVERLRSHSGFAAEVTPSADVVSVKALVGFIIAVGAAVGAAVGVYIKVAGD